MDPVFLIIGLVVFVVVYSTVGPACFIYSFGLIWAINTLFNLNIPFTFGTWCASLLLVTIIHKAASN